MRLLIDENVRADTAAFLRERGHEILLVSRAGELGERTPDERIVAFAEEGAYIVVTMDHDFRSLIRRVPISGRRLRRAGRLSLRCTPLQSRRRLSSVIETIDFEHSLCVRDGRRFIVTVTNTTVVIVR